MLMEIIWIALSLLCLVLGILATLKSGFSQSYTLFLLALLALLMFYLRYRTRKKDSFNQDNKP